MLFVEKFKNIQSMENRKVNFADRLVTFEGTPNQIIYEKINSPAIIERIHHLSNLIYQHLYLVSRGGHQVQSMIYYAKIDKQQKIWILFFEKVQFNLTVSQ